MCTFLENDIATENVYDTYGAKISKNIQVECSQCKEYVYKGQDGCATYSKDPFLDIKDRDTGVNLSVCTALAFPRKCEEIFKSPPTVQSPNVKDQMTLLEPQQSTGGGLASKSKVLI
jgi:hypothetical protein